MRRFYFGAERDEEGRVKPPKAPPGKPRSPRDVFVRFWKLRGLRDDLIEKLWNDLQ